MAPPPSPPPKEIETDVLIVGAGPVGLLLAYQLRLFSLPKYPFAADSLSPPSTASGKPISVHIIEAHLRPLQQTYGRAVTFWPRSMELLAQLPTPDGVSSLGEDILQQCYAVRHSAAYDDGGREKDGSWGFIESINDTRYAFASVLRQKYVEDIFRHRLAQLGVTVHQPHRFEDLVIDKSIPAGQMGRVRARISSTMTTSPTGEDVEHEYFVKARYIIGCDGSRTKVRGAAGIESVGDRTEEKWVRIDGVLSHTTMPKPRCYGAIESETYGNVLWIPLDHRATRLGFAFNEERRRKYAGEKNEDVFVKEAKECVKPFTIEYERVDWASVYSVGQRLARTFWKDECVFLAGDSAHTHSSGAGQGMNAGVNDAVNLGWKLAGVLMGRAKPEILDTYDGERRPNAERLIRYDEEISMLVSGRWPKGRAYEECKERGENVNEVLTKVLRGAKGFNTGLTISYEENPMVWKAESATNGEAKGAKGAIPAPALPGWRAPDVKLLAPALWSEVWLQSLMKNRADFHLVLFLGRGDMGRESFREFKKAVEKLFAVSERTAKLETNGLESAHVNGEAHRPDLPLKYITILPQTVDNGWHDLKTDPLGQVYYDGDGSAGSRYAIDPERGSVFIIRPCGWIGAKLNMDERAPADVLRYLEGMFLSC